MIRLKKKYTNIYYIKVNDYVVKLMFVMIISLIIINGYCCYCENTFVFLNTEYL